MFMDFPEGVRVPGTVKEYEKKAAELIENVTSKNALLYSNIHSNLGMMYLTRENFEKAKEHIEEGIRILNEFNLMYTHDTIPQACNYAILRAKTGNIHDAMTILSKAEKYAIKASGEYSSDHENIEEAMGGIMASAGRIRDARGHFRKVLKIHAEINGYNKSELWRVAQNLCAYLSDEGDELFSLMDYGRGLCEENS